MSSEINPSIRYNKSTNRFFIKSDDKFYPVSLDEINWISVEGNYCKIYAMDRVFVVRISLAKIKTYLIGYTFVQVNKSDLINITKIDVYDPAGKIMIGNQDISISRRYKKGLENSLQFLP